MEYALAALVVGISALVASVIIVLFRLLRLLDDVLDKLSLLAGLPALKNGVVQQGELKAFVPEDRDDASEEPKLEAYNASDMSIWDALRREHEEEASRG